MATMAFRVMALLLVQVPQADEATRQARQIAQALSEIPYGHGITSAVLSVPANGAEPDPLGTGFACPLQGHLNVEAPNTTSARQTAQRWKQIVETNLGQHGWAFGRFDLHGL